MHAKDWCGVDYADGCVSSYTNGCANGHVDGCATGCADGIVMANLMVAETFMPVALIGVLMVVLMVAPMDVPLIPKRFHVAMLWLSKVMSCVPTKIVERVAAPENKMVRTLAHLLIMR